MAEMQEVKVGNQILKFPASMSKDEIADVLRKSPPPTQTPQETVARPTTEQALVEPPAPTTPTEAPEPTETVPTPQPASPSIDTEALNAATQGETISYDQPQELGYGDLDYWTNLQRWKSSFVDLLPTLGTLAVASNPATATVSTGLNMVAMGTLGAQLRDTIKSVENSLFGEDLSNAEDRSTEDITSMVFNQALDVVTDGAYETVVAVGGGKVLNKIVETTAPLVKSGGGAIKNAVDDKRLGITQFIKESALDAEEVALYTRIQDGLQKVKSTMMPSQIDPTNTVAASIENVAAASLKGNSMMEANAAGIATYLRGRIGEAVQGFGKMGREGFGKAIQETLKTARTASSLNFSMRYAELDKLGKNVPISFRRLQALTRQAGNSEVSATIISKAAQERGVTRLKFLGDASLKSLREDILNMSPQPTFAQAHAVLKQINRKIDDLFDAANPKKPIIKDLLELKREVQTAMRAGASNADNPRLFKEYQKITSDYHKSANILYSETANTLAALNKPEMAGEFLAKVGNVTEPKMFKALVNQIKAMGVKGSDKDFMGSLKSGFLAQHLRAPFGGFNKNFDPFAHINNFSEALTDPKMHDTLKVLFSKSEIDDLMMLSKEAEVLSRGASGQLALAVAAGQVGAAKSVFDINRSLTRRATDILTFITPNYLAKVVTDPKLANKMLGRMKALNSAVVRGNDKQVETLTSEIVGMFSAISVAKASEADAQQSQYAADQAVDQTNAEIADIERQLAELENQ